MSRTELFRAVMDGDKKGFASFIATGESVAKMVDPKFGFNAAQ